MKRSLGICVVMCCALIGLGSAIRCYNCEENTGSCSEQTDCGHDGDACLKLTESEGMTHRQCLKYSDCKYSRLGQMFPKVSSFTFSCCNSDLCNSAPSSAASSLIGLLASVAVMWWCIY